MKILALQLKRIGDLVLTAPALAAIKTAYPEAHLTLAAHEGTAALLPAIRPIDAGIVFGAGRGWTPWQQVLTGGFTHVLDFTGTDRSATATALSRAPRRITFEWVRKNRVRQLAYTDFIASSVRENHTLEHYRHLAEPLGLPDSPATEALYPRDALAVPHAAIAEANRLLAVAGVHGPFVVIHPGTAREEKYWAAERWAEVVTYLRQKPGLDCVITGGSNPFEQAHLGEIQKMIASSSGAGAVHSLAGKIDLLTLAAIVSRSSLVLSCDTAVAHLAAAFRRPQVALFGPTNPFHWRPLHADSVVLSAAQPDAPLAKFTPRMKGAPMDRLSTGAIIRATEALLARTHPE